MNLFEAIRWTYSSGLPAKCKLHGDEVRLIYVSPHQGCGRFLLETYRNMVKVREELLSEQLVTAAWEKVVPCGPTLDLMVPEFVQKESQ